MNLVQTQISFEAAHRLYDVATYSSECRDNLHGHSYKVTITVGRDNLNDAGMVMDFKLLKTICRSQIEDIYDHSCILKSDDPLVGPITECCKKVIITEENPTAEWMAVEYARIVNTALANIDSSVYVYSLAVQETENNIAIYQREV